MIGAIQSNVLTSIGNTQYGQTQKAGKATDTKGPEKKAEQQLPVDGTVTTSIDGDTVTISSAGAAASRAEMKDVTPDVVSDNAVTAAAGTSADVGTKALNSIKTEADAGASEEESLIDDLSDYTDTELEQMLYKGEITQSEYDDEMKDRNGSLPEVEA